MSYSLEDVGKVPGGDTLVSYLRVAHNDDGTDKGGGSTSGDTLNTVAASGSAQTINYSTADVWDITLTANCTFTLTGFTNAKPNYLTLVLRQDATGSRTVTWPAITWIGSGSAPTLQTAAAAVDSVVLFSFDGGTTVFGIAQQSASTSVTTEIAYDEITTNVAITSNLSTSLNTIIPGSAHTYDGNPVIVEFYTSRYDAQSTAGASLVLCLMEGSNNLGRLAIVTNAVSAAFAIPLLVRRRFIPSAGSHTYSIAAYQTSGSGTIEAGAGGAVGNQLPSYLRITKAA